MRPSIMILAGALAAAEPATAADSTCIGQSISNCQRNPRFDHYEVAGGCKLVCYGAPILSKGGVRVFPIVDHKDCCVFSQSSCDP